MAECAKPTQYPRSSHSFLSKIPIAIGSTRDGLNTFSHFTLRTLLKEKGKDEYDKQKKNLSGVTLAGTMGDKRNNDSIVDYSGLIHLDYDYIQDVEELRSKIEDTSFTYASFISPSGNGLKVVIRTDAKMDEHQHYFNAIKKLYDKSVGVESDGMVKDLARLCDKFINSVEQKFRMTRKQGEKLDETFAAILEENIALYREEIKGVTYGLGLMCYKIAMVLTALRSNEESLTCSDDDFETALYLVEKVYLVHSIELLKTIGGKSSKLPRTQQDLLDWINSSNKNLTKSEILVKTDELGIPERTTNKILRRFLNSNLIDIVSRGVYAAKM